VERRELEGEDEWLVYEDDFCWVRAGRLRHRVPCYGYVVSEKPGKLKIDVAKATALGVPPGRAYRTFQNGKDVSLDDGSLVRAAEVTRPPPPPRKVAVFGDTSGPSQTLARLAEGSDLLVHEATVSDVEIEKAISRGHSTPKMAGAFAKNVKARWLALTHFSARYLAVPPNRRQNNNNNNNNNQKNAANDEVTTLDATNANTIELLLKEAKRAFASNNVLAAHDFMAVQVPRKITTTSEQHQDLDDDDDDATNDDDNFDDDDDDGLQQSSRSPGE